MVQSMILADNSIQYQTKEVVILYVALAWVIALGSVALAAIIICGWHGAYKVVFDWTHKVVAFYCR